MLARSLPDIHTVVAAPSLSVLPDLMPPACRSFGCRDKSCALCRQAQHRRCLSTLANKYLSGDLLTAKCGAPIMVDVISSRTGQPARTGLPPGMLLEVSCSCAAIQGGVSCHASNKLWYGAGTAGLGPGPTQGMLPDLGAAAPEASKGAVLLCTCFHEALVRGRHSTTRGQP